MPDEVFEPSGWASGNHKPDGLFLAWGPDIAEGLHVEDLAIADLLPTVFAFMGVPIPDDVDGQVRREVARPGHAPRALWTEAAAYTTAAGERDAATDRAIEERLRGLGYLQ